MLQRGDLLLEKSGGGQQQPVGAVVQYDKDECAVCSNFVARMPVARGYSSRFLSYLHAALYSCGINLRSIKQTTGIQNLDSQQYLDERVAVPPEAEQCEIAAFLDREAARLDGLIAKKEHLIEVLEEKRTALISEVVTKGLDPSVPMKESGVEWIGAVPAHWDVLSLRRVVDRFVDYRGQTPEKRSSGVPLVTAKNITNGRIDYAASEEYIDPMDYDDWMVRGLPARGDVLLTTEAPLGEVAQVDDPHIALAQRIILFKVNPLRMTNDYLKYAFLSPSGTNDLLSRGTGSTAIGIKATRLREVLVPVPPIPEQEVLTRELDRRLAGFAPAANTIHTAIDRLREYRTALITAAVTGQIDIREGGLREARPADRTAARVVAKR